MAKEIKFNKPVLRARTRARRIAILKKVCKEIQSDPELRRAVRRFIRLTT